MTMDFVTPAGDAQVGNLATPLNSSAFSRIFINNLPAYRRGLSPFRRGLEVGMAHGYLLFGPFAFTSQFRNTDQANLVGVIEAAALVLILSICLSLYASVTQSKPVATVTTPNPPEAFGTNEGWSEFAGGFLVGGIGGAFAAYWLTTSGLFQIIPQSLLS